MPKIEVTAELCDTLRSLRIQNKLQSKDVAMQIGRSPAYLSRLENGYIAHIDYNTLNVLIKTITRQDEIDHNVIETIINNLNIKYTKEDIDKQLWLTNYDTLKCMIPIPSHMIDTINEMLDQNNISRDYLLKRINANEALDQDDIKKSKLQHNIWFQNKNEDHPSHSIIIDMTRKDLDAYLDKTKTSGPYIFIFCIVFYIKKIIKYGNLVKLENNIYEDLYNETSEFLKSFKFMTYTEKAALVGAAKSADELDSLMNSFDDKFYKLTGEIFAGFKALSEHNIETTTERLESFKDNMRWDLGFMLKLVDLPFRDLEDTSIDNRKKVLKEIECLIVKYTNLPKSNNIESY